MKQSEIVYKHKLGSYVYIYDNIGFIHILDGDNVEDPNTQCLGTLKCVCKTKKEFEMEVLYLHSNSIVQLNTEED